MNTPAQYNPEAIRKLYNPQEIIAREQKRKNKIKQDVINNTNKQQQQMLQQQQSQQKDPYLLVAQMLIKILIWSNQKII